MGKIIFLALIVAAIFVTQQSRVIEVVKVRDAALGVSIDQYRVNWNNLKDYFGDIEKKIKRSKSRHNRYR